MVEIRFCKICNKIIQGKYGEIKCSTCGNSFPSGILEEIEEKTITTLVDEILR